MAKILKRFFLLIPILFIFTFNIKNVLAATLRSSNGQFYSFDLYTSNTIPSTYTLLANITRNETPIDFVYRNGVTYNYNYIKFKDTTTDNYWLFIFYDNADDISRIDYSTTDNIFTHYNCVPRVSCDTNNSSYNYFYITSDNYTYSQCQSFFNNYGFALNSTYACNIINGLSSSNNYIYYLGDYTNYNSEGLTGLIDTLKDYEIEMPEGSSFYIDNVLYYPERPIPEPEPEPEPEPPENLDKIFVPNYEEGQCIEIIDKDTLRVFLNENANNYVDYYVNSHYLSKKGQVEVDYVKKCSTLEFTSIGYYRNDFPEILLIIGSLAFFTIIFVYILFNRFRKR